VSGPESVRRRVPDDHFSAGNRHRRRQVGNTAFLFAAKSADVEVMRLLVEHGADPKMNTLLNITPLMRRCFTHSLDTLGVLTKFSGHPQANYPRFEAPHNHVGRGRFSVFHEACADATSPTVDFPTAPFY
jgi:ankyrin repeat protein